MRIKKTVLDNIPRCYCAGHVTVDGVTRVVLASEEVDGPCYAYYGDDFELRETVWEKAGGTMSFVEIPHTNGEFLAVQNFFPGFNSANAKIVWGRYENGTWVVRDFLHLPYVHRFDILHSEGKLYFLGATLCGSKRNRDDWADPGALWVGELPKDLNEKMSIRIIKEFMLKNHGYFRTAEQSGQIGLVTCDSGLYRVRPPKKGADWEVEQMLADRISDVAAYDLDGDGEDELAIIAPFHGNELSIRKKIDPNRYETIYTYPDEMEFAHAVWAGDLLGVPTIVFGIRRAGCELGYIQRDPETGVYAAHVIDSGVGTANVDIVHREGKEWLVAANHTKNEAAVYILTEK